MLESIFHFFSNLFGSLLTLMKILIGSSLFLKHHKAKKNSIVIMGNGPSLKKNLNEDLSALKNQTLLGVNNLPSTDVFEALKPAYFIIVSDEYWQPDKIARSQKIRDDIIENLVKKTTWPLVFYIPASAKKKKSFIEKIENNPNITISFYNKTPVEGLALISQFFMRMGWGMPRPHNVLIPGIFNCINAGFKKIYLIGADHSWLPLLSVDDNNNALVNFHHFYDENTTNKDTMYKKSKPRSLYQILEKFTFTFKAYFILRDYAVYKGASIVNCTPGSFIDAFERKELSDVLISEQLSKQNLTVN